MQDKFGNTLSVGDTVVYFSTDMTKTARIGTIQSMDGGRLGLQTQSGRTIARSPHTVIHYTGLLS